MTVYEARLDIVPMAECNRCMTSADPIAVRSLDLLKSSGERLAFRVEFGPVVADGQSFKCRVRFHGWGDSPPDIWGYDSLQALLLAVALVHSILDDFVTRGGRVLWPGTDMDYDLDAFQFSDDEPHKDGTEPPASAQPR